MYEYVAEERTVKALALLGVLAMVGMVLMPIGISDIGAYLASQGGGAI